MEHQLWKAIVAVLGTLGKGQVARRCVFSDQVIVRVFYWSVIHDRPVSWAVQLQHWPPHLRKQVLPSNATMSRRLRRPSVKALLSALERRVVAPTTTGVCWFIDGKPLMISSYSKDRQAGYGWATGSQAKGYKVHVLAGPRGELADWRVAPMNKDERVMARRLLRTAAVQGYVVADGNYDATPLHQICEARGNLQLVAPRQHPGRPTGHRRQSPARLRAIALLEGPTPAFGQGLLAARTQVERHFGNWTNWGGGLNGLPAWVRSYHRVHRWVQAKLALTALRSQLRHPSYVA